jgi:CRISPR-associated endoribonuclease Cas6
MFLELLESVDPGVARRLHDDSRYRPYTLSPLSVGDLSTRAAGPGTADAPFGGFRLPSRRRLRANTPCSLRITLLEDDLFPTFSRYFLTRAEPSFRLGGVEFQVTNVLVTDSDRHPWSRYTPYTELLARAERPAAPPRRIGLHFCSPTSFRIGDVDLPLPLPRLVFQSYARRFREFCPAAAFPPDFADLVERHTGINRLNRARTDTIRTKRVVLTGFTGQVSFEVSKKAPPTLLAQMQMLADFAFFCGTGRKTTVGMGQTVRIPMKYEE